MFELLGMIRQGGWTMVPLILCSITALTIIIERAIALRRVHIIDARLVRLIQEYRGEEQAEPTLVIFQRHHSPLARVLAETLRARHLNHDQSMEAMRAVGRSQVVGMERGLTLLEIIAGVSPLLGLLGTVLGMVAVFNAIALHGLGNPQVLSDGIAKALITTIAGLCIAIPAAAFHSILTKRVDDLAIEMQDLAVSFLLKLEKFKS